MTKKEQLEKRLAKAKLDAENLQKQIEAETAKVQVKPKPPTKSGQYVIIRTLSAGVHAGTLKHRNGLEVILTDSRRIWYWDGAASLSELATKGTSSPAKCKFPAPIPEITLLQAIEIIPVTADARKSIESVAIWTKH